MPTAAHRTRPALLFVAASVGAALLVLGCTDSVEALPGSPDGGSDAAQTSECGGCSAAPACLPDGGAPPLSAYRCSCPCGGAGPTDGGAIVCTSLGCLTFVPNGTGDASDAGTDAADDAPSDATPD